MILFGHFYVYDKEYQEKREQAAVWRAAVMLVDLMQHDLARRRMREVLER